MKESLIIGLLFIFLVTILLCEDVKSSFNLSSSIKRQILSRSQRIPYKAIDKVSTWWQWMLSDFVDIFYPTSSECSDDYCADKQAFVSANLLIGGIQLRQLRTAERACELKHPYSLHLPADCRFGYSSNAIDTSAYGVNDSWLYQQSGVTRAGTYSGRLHRYTGGGHALTLPNQRSGVLERVQELKDALWIDKRTRAVFTEMLLFNAPTNLFTSLILSIEIPESGGVFPSFRVLSTTLYRYSTSKDYFLQTCELLFIVIMLTKTCCTIVEIFKLGKKYFKDPWNWLETLFCFLSLIFTFCYVQRFVVIGSTIEQLRSTYFHQFVDVTQAQRWQEVMKMFLGFLILIVSLQLLKLLRNRPLFLKLGLTIKHSIKALIFILIMFFLVIIAYMSLGLAAFRPYHEGFSEGFMTIQCLLVLMTRRMEYKNLDDLPIAPRHAIRIFLMTFTVFGVGLISAYAIAVLLEEYRRHHRSRTFVAMRDKDAIKLLWRMLLHYTNIRPLSEKEQEKVKPPPPTEFTMAEIEYQVDEMLFKMNSLCGPSILLDKPVPIYYTDSETGGPDYRQLDSCDPYPLHPYNDQHAIHDSNYYEEQEVHVDMAMDEVLHRDNNKGLSYDSLIDSSISSGQYNQLREQLEWEIYRRLQRKNHANSSVKDGLATYPPPTSAVNAQRQVLNRKVGSCSSNSAENLSSTDNASSSTEDSLFHDTGFRHIDPADLTNHKFNKLSFPKPSIPSAPTLYHALSESQRAIDTANIESRTTSERVSPDCAGAGPPLADTSSVRTQSTWLTTKQTTHNMAAAAHSHDASSVRTQSTWLSPQQSNDRGDEGTQSNAQSLHKPSAFLTNSAEPHVNQPSHWHNIKRNVPDRNNYDDHEEIALQDFEVIKEDVERRLSAPPLHGYGGQLTDTSGSESDFDNLYARTVAEAAASSQDVAQNRTLKKLHSRQLGNETSQQQQPSEIQPAQTDFRSITEAVLSRLNSKERDNWWQSVVITADRSILTSHVSSSGSESEPELGNAKHVKSKGQKSRQQPHALHRSKGVDNKAFYF